MRITKELAAKIAHRIVNPDLSELRDGLDILTGGELDCIQLDLLEDLVRKEVAAQTSVMSEKELFRKKVDILRPLLDC